jgi:hypothetical protein
MAVPQEAIDAGVRWWMDVLARGAKQDNGDTHNPLAGVLATMLAAVVPPTPEQVERFGAVLRDQLRADLIGVEAPRLSARMLSVDYGPDVRLSHAAQLSGVDPSRFPMKTTMWIAEDGLRVSYGYGAPREKIWPVIEDAS